jgi:hypothetical protein
VGTFFGYIRLLICATSSTNTKLLPSPPSAMTVDTSPSRRTCSIDLTDRRVKLIYQVTRIFYPTFYGTPSLQPSVHCTAQGLSATIVIMACRNTSMTRAHSLAGVSTALRPQPPRESPPQINPSITLYCTLSPSYPFPHSPNRNGFSSCRRLDKYHPPLITSN